MGKPNRVVIAAAAATVALMGPAAAGAAEYFYTSSFDTINTTYIVGHDVDTGALVSVLHAPGYVTNFTVGSGSIFYQTDTDIYRANLDLTGATAVYHGASISMAAANGVLYTSSFDTINTTYIVGHDVDTGALVSVLHAPGYVTNFTVDGDSIFYQTDTDIYRANLDLTGATAVYHGASISIGAYATPAGAGVPEPAAWGLMILGFSAMGVALRRPRPLLA